MQEKFLRQNGHEHLLKNGSIQDKLRISNQAIRDNGQLFVVVRNGQEYLTTPAREAWRRAGVDEAAINTLITENSIWKFSIDPTYLVNLVATATPMDLIKVLQQLFIPIYAPVQKTLDSTAPIPAYGFNSHEVDSHILVLIQHLLANRLLLTERDINLIVLALFLHDQGNALNRSAHSAVSHDMANLEVENFNTITEFQRISHAVLFHEESFFNPEIESMILWSLEEAKRVGESPSALLLKKFSRTFANLASIVWILDKTDVGRNRLMNTRFQESGKLPAGALQDEKDPHFFYNSCWSYVRSEIEEKHQPQFICEFNLNLSPDEWVITKDDKLNVINKPKTEQRPDGQDIIYVRDYIRERYTKFDIPYLHTIVVETLKLYTHRLLGIVPHAFNLDSGIQKVILRFNDGDKFTDKDGNHRYYPPVEFIFDRSVFLEQMLSFEATLRAKGSSIRIEDLTQELIHEKKAY